MQPRAGNGCASPTETNVVTIGDQPRVAVPPFPPHLLSADTRQMGLLYVRMDPLDAFLADPWEAPVPEEFVSQETKRVAGVQPKAFFCADFVWFAECEPAAWMDTNETPAPRTPSRPERRTGGGAPSSAELRRRRIPHATFMPPHAGAPAADVPPGANRCMARLRPVALGTSMLLLAATMLLAAFAAPAVAPHICDPYPIGRCGDYQREAVIHCYLLVAGQYRSPTDPHVVTIGGTPPNVVAVDQVVAGQLYFRLGPTETLVNDPYDAPLPYKSLYREDNSVAGLQPSRYKCATFVWFAECEPAQWMGPVAPFDKDPDEVVL